MIKFVGLGSEKKEIEFYKNSHRSATVYNIYKEEEKYFRQYGNVGEVNHQCSFREINIDEWEVWYPACR